MEKIKFFLTGILNIILLILMGIEILIRGLLYFITFFKFPKLIKTNNLFVITIYYKLQNSVSTNRIKYGKWIHKTRCVYCDNDVNKKAKYCESCGKSNPETGKVMYYIISTRNGENRKTGNIHVEMKTFYSMLIVSLFLIGCKKNQNQPIPVNNTPQCQVATQNFTGKYYTYNTARVDTLTISFIQDNCPNISNSNKYRIDNLGSVMNSWGVGVEYRKYYVDCDETTQTGSIIDTLKMDLYDSTNLRISVKENGVFTPFLILKRK